MTSSIKNLKKKKKKKTAEKLLKCRASRAGEHCEGIIQINWRVITSSECCADTKQTVISPRTLLNSWEQVQKCARGGAGRWVWHQIKPVLFRFSVKLFYMYTFAKTLRIINNTVKRVL